ncbi:MAG: peptidoglycan DD-metalloendopeptidase family protein [Woeseia sp.]
MPKPVSPLLHDYKSSALSQPAKLRAWQWFAFGLGLPLLIVTGMLSFGSADGGNPQGSTETEHTAELVPAEPVTVLALADAETPVERLTEKNLPNSSVPDEQIEVAAQRPDAAPVQSFVAADDSTAPLQDDFRPPLALPPLPQYDTITHTVRSGDTLEKLFRKNKISLQDLAKIVRLPDASPHLVKLRPGDTFEIKHDGNKLISLYRELSLTRALEISREDETFAAMLIDRPIDVRRKHAYGRIETSLFESAAAAGLPDKLIMNLAGIFAWDVDFVLDIRTGDDYYILYEEIWQDGEFVTTGEILAAEFNNAGRTNHAIRFTDREGRSDYFTPEGRSVRKAFVRAPVDFTRISSNFNPRRKHPVLNTIRAHKGVDYAAPRGTPIKAAGDGKVIFRGRKGGYGNAVILQHGGNITTLYAHLSSFAKSAGNGRRVKQGQTIGFVGSTGLATAAHLHYEYRVNGVHRNPRTVSLPQADPIRDEYRAEFLASAQPILDELNSYKRTQIASLTSE